MTLMPGIQYFLCGHRCAPPPQPALPEARHGGPPQFRVLRMGRYKMGNRIAMARDGDGFATLDVAQESGEMRL